jgi:hypothetical protein
MRRVLTGLVVILVWTVSTTVTAAGADERATLNIRIHDYAVLPKEPIARTQSLVSAYYRAIGVNTKWRTAWQPARQTASEHADTATFFDIRDLTVIILSRGMALEKELPVGAVGSATSTLEANGRVAYVLYDRVVAAAFGAGWDPVELMSVVIAHEIGHLLLPYGSHTRDGLMRGHWDTTTLRGIDPRTLRFTADQADKMRQVLHISDAAPQLAAGPAAP